MTENQMKLIIGSLLHDIGKVVYRTGDNRNHSQSGYEFLRQQGIEDSIILNCVRFHHGKYLKDAKLDRSDPAYLTYYADNIAAAIDRRESDKAEDGFDKKTPLASVFNILNGNNQDYHFTRQVLDLKKGMNYPTSTNLKMDEGFYQTIIDNIQHELKAIQFSEEYIHSLLSILEVNLSYIPSSTSKRELADISLFDHVKMTAALAICMEQYLHEQQVEDYKDKLFIRAEKTYEEEAFLLYAMDLSGIQSFIYTIASEGALRGLRARSFYLEVLMEQVIDELLKALSLSRTCLMYSGGGHCYILLPNTAFVKQTLKEQENKVNSWLIEHFGTALYIAGGYAPASANALKNKPLGSYSQLYLTISKKISEKKAHRYNAEQIMRLNNKKHKGERECVVCRKVDHLDTNNRCPICAALHQLSSHVLYEPFFTVINKPEPDALPLPTHHYLVAENKEQLISRMQRPEYVQSYTKNELYTGKHIATKLWVADYTTGDTFDTFTQKARGIERLGILRADVDNLGHTFVSGFKQKDGNDRYATLSRTATLSRQLSLFFKCYINQILEVGESNWLSPKGKRNITVVYAGGDDLFLVGAWNEVIDAFIDIKNHLKRFTQNTLTLSGGIGIYHSGYPINLMAKEVAYLEECSKQQDGKNAITLFEETGTYAWPIFEEKVLGEKFKTIKDFFESSEDRGKAFLYHLVELLRNTEDKMNMARYVYLLSRMEPDSNSEQQQAYRYFSQKMYDWSKDKEERKQVITAIYLYIYLKRETRREQDEIR